MLATRKAAFPLRVDDLSEYDLAGMVVCPADGTEITDDNPAYVAVHSGLDRPMQRLIYAHEVGHAILGHEGQLRLSEMDSWFTNRLEREAWQVAAQLLVPQSLLWAAAQHGWSPSHVAALCAVPEWLVAMHPR